MRAPSAVLTMMRAGAGATLALAVGCGQPAAAELHEVSRAPVGVAAMTPIAATAPPPPVVLVPVPATPVAPLPAGVSVPPTLAGDSTAQTAQNDAPAPRPVRRRRSRRFPYVLRSPNIIDIAPMCGRG